MLVEAAESEPVPPQEPPFRSKAVVVLQLLKRWRNVQYDTRLGRRPPSILIAKLSEELLIQAYAGTSSSVSTTQGAAFTSLILFANRMFPDRQDQALFIDDLKNLVAKVSGRDLEEIKKIMVELFRRRLWSSLRQTMGARYAWAKPAPSRYRQFVLPTTAAEHVPFHRVRCPPKHTGD